MSNETIYVFPSFTSLACYLFNRKTQGNSSFIKHNFEHHFKLFFLIIIFSMLNSIYSSTEINNTSTISDIYMENILLKTNSINKNKKYLKHQKNKLNRITFEEISEKQNLKNSQKEKEEALMNYYSEYISLIKDMAEESDEKEDLNKNEIGELNENSDHNNEEFYQISNEQINCIMFGKSCKYESLITEEGRSILKQKKILMQNNNENNNLNESEDQKYQKKTDSYKFSFTFRDEYEYLNTDQIQRKSTENNNNYKKDRNANNKHKENIDKNFKENSNNYVNNNNHKDLYEEVTSEYFNNHQDQKKLFDFSVKALYGNSTLFNFNIEDLENLIKKNYLTDGQAILLWETLTMSKTDRLKNLNIQREMETDSEIYIFNLIPIKCLSLIILNFGICIIGYNILLSYNTKDRDKTSYLINIIIISFCLYSGENFYSWKYYLVTTEMFILFLCALKFFFDSIFYKFGYAIEDFSVFGYFSKTKNTTQFILKIINMFLCTFFVGVFSFTKFPHFYNYILFYFCVTQMINLISVFLQYEVPAIFQPFRHFAMIILGLMNFFFINFHKKNFHNHKWISYKRSDSFYLIGDLYTFYCFSYFYDYLFIQANNISKLFYEKNLDNEKINSQISSTMKEHSEMNKQFTIDDSFWILGFAFGTLIQYVGLSENKYLVFYFSFYFFKTSLSIFGRQYHIRYLRFIYNIFVFLFLITNYLISNKNDDLLFEVNLILFCQ